MPDTDFSAKLRGETLLTAEVLYYMPDHRSILQSFMFQSLDAAPGFPRLAAFLDHWRREVQAVIHSIRIAHSQWIGPSDFTHADVELLIGRNSTVPRFH